MALSHLNPKRPEAEPWLKPLNPSEHVAHALARITFGPRPADFTRVQAISLEAFVDEQLHPERLDDDAVEKRLATLPTFSMTTGELIQNYPAPKPAEAGRAQNSKFEGAEPGPMLADTAAEVLIELGCEELLRAVYSTRQLQEVLVQFWMNHFNIFAGKGPERWMLTSFERDTIRPRVLSRFEDLLVATAQSPAMLFYLDNWLSSAALPVETSAAGQAGPRPAIGPKQLRRGLNENYGRELMELHTLGVTGGYTQRDVIEVARCLTGWTLRRPQLEPEFSFDPRLHDAGPKTVLGHYIAAGGGIGDGLQVLHLLATHPSTARFISTKLCRRFVSDDPPAALVERASREFMRTQGDLRSVLSSILRAPEFYSEGAYRAKIKSPLELVASALRATEAETDGGMPLLGFMGRMGEPRFQLQAPSGFPDRGNTWMSSSSLMARLDFATLLAFNRIRGTEIKWSQALNRAASGLNESAIDELSLILMGTRLSSASRQAILNSVEQTRSASREGSSPEQAESGFAALATMASLVMGSPEFQRR